MNGLWAVLLMNSFVACVLAVAAALVMRVMKRPALAHVLWLLVLAKLMTPPLWTVPVPWGAGVPSVESQHLLVTAAEPSRDLLPVIPPPTIEVGIIPNDARPSPSSPTAAVEAAPGVTVNYTAVVLSVWIGGSVLSLIVLTRRVRRLRQILSLSDPGSPDLLVRVRLLSDRFGLKSAPDVRLIPLDISPAVCWLGGLPMLLIPRTLFSAMSDVERDALVAHELAHVRRRDHWVRAFEAVVGVVFWWHPLLWLAVREIRDAEEQCCDAWVVWALPHRGPDYANALVTTLDFVSRRRNNELVPLASGMGRLGHLQRRLTMICTRPAPRTLSAVGRLVVAGTLLALPLMPVLSPTARAQQDQRDAADAGAKRSNEDVAVAALIDACRDADAEVRMAAFESLTQFKEAAVPALLDALANDAKRSIAIGALQRISYPALPGLLKGLEHRDARTRAAVAEAISQTLVPDGAYFPLQPQQQGGMMPGMAPGAGMGAPGGFTGYRGMSGAPASGLFALPIDSSEELKRFESIRKQTATALAKAIEDPDAAVRRHVTIALGKIGAEADVVVPALLAALKDRDAEVRRYATQALVPAAHMSPATVTPALVAALKDPDAQVRSAASLGLLNLGSSAKEALPALVELLKDEDPAVRRMAAAAIGRVRNEPKAEQPPGSGYDPAGAGSPYGGRRGR